MSHYHDQAIADAEFQKEWVPKWNAAFDRWQKAKEALPLSFPIRHHWARLQRLPLQVQAIRLNEWAEDLERYSNPTPVSAETLDDLHQRICGDDELPPPPKPSRKRVILYWIIRILIIAAIIALAIATAPV
jgi:hypothetical protein